MVVVFEGFSIREYAAKMRGVDVVKCWPFTGAAADEDTIDEQDVQRFLPPMRVTKFRWWAHELDVIRSTQDAATILENASPQPEIPRSGGSATANFVAEAQPFAVNSNADSCQVAHHENSKEERSRMKLAKGKLKAPKKRSIVEIFADARRIEKDDVDGKEDKLNCTNVALNSKIKKKKMKKVMIVNKLIKKKKNKLKKHVQTSNKEMSKLKLQSSAKFPKKVNDSSSNSNIAKDVLDSATISKMKQDLRCMSSKKKHKVAQASKLITKHTEPDVFPVRGILKNHAKDVSDKNVAVCRLQSDSQINTSGVQISKRQVRFSGKDDILGPREESISSFGKSIFNSDTLASLSDMDKSCGTKNDLATVIVNGVDADDISFRVRNGIRTPPVSHTHLLPHSSDLQNVPRPHGTYQDKLKNLPEESTVLRRYSLCKDNLCMSDRVNAETFPYVGLPGHLSRVIEECTPSANSQIRGSRPTKASPHLVDYFEDRSFDDAAMSSLVNSRAISKSSSPGVAINKNANTRLPDLSQFAAENMSGHPLQYQPLKHMSSVEFTGACDLFRFPISNDFTRDGFFCLPLNSQGELIHASSSGKGSVNQQNNSNFVVGSSSGMVDSLSMKGNDFIKKTLPSNQLNLFPTENYVKDTSNVPLPARLGVTENGIHCTKSGSRNNHSMCLSGSEQNPKYVSFSGLRQCKPVQNQDGRKMIYPEENSDLMLLNTTQLTMRLMGKDVAVIGSKEMERHSHGKVSTSKGVISDCCSMPPALGNIPFKTHCQPDWHLYPRMGKSRQLLENQALHSNRQMEAIDPRFFHPCLNSGSNAVFQNNWPSTNITPGPTMHHVINLPNCSATFSTVTNHDTFIPGPETVRIGSQPPILSTPHRNNLHMDWHPGEPKYSVPQTAKSTFNFPFLHPDYHNEQYVRPSWSYGRSKSVFPWLSHPTPVNMPIGPQQQIFNVNGNYQGNQNRENLFPASFQSPVDFTYEHVQSSISPASMVQQSFVPTGSRSKFASSININFDERNTANEKMQSKPFGINNQDVFEKTTKRSAAWEDYSTRARKLPNLGIQDGLGALTELTSEDFSKNIQYNVRAFETCAQRDHASSSKCRPEGRQHEKLQIELDSPDNVETSDLGGHPNNVSQRLDLGISHGVDASKANRMARSRGPIRLSAGAKHIIKPSQNTEQDNSKRVHSTIPCAAVIESSNLLESQKKSTKVYMF